MLSYTPPGLPAGMLGATDYMIPELDPNFLGGLGATEEELKKLGRDLAALVPPTPATLVNALLPFSPAERDVVLQAFAEAGGNTLLIPPAREELATRAKLAPGGGRQPFLQRRTVRTAWYALGTLSMAASAFHGYRRNQSVGWALAWGALGALFPVITPTIALAQGFGQPK